MVLSVVIPVYNVAQYLEQCVDSVLASQETDCSAPPQCVVLSVCGAGRSLLSGKDQNLPGQEGVISWS